MKACDLRRRQLHSDPHAISIVFSRRLALADKSLRKAVPSNFKPLNALREFEGAAPLAKELSLTPVQPAECQPPGRRSRTGPCPGKPVIDMSPPMPCAIWSKLGR